MTAEKVLAPKVSVIAVSYNQEKYIRKTLESLIAQKTDFAFEIVAADDCSTDKTPKIIQEYAKSYPKIVKPILREKNIGITQNFVQTFQVASGEYIALCEGDDFWTDSSKLQKQIDFLDSHPEYALCFHPVRVFFENAEEEEYIYPEVKTNFTVHELLKENFIQTNSVVYRKQKYTNMPHNILPIDWYLHLYHAQFGKIGFIDRVMSAYRKHPGGVWWESFKMIDEIWKKHGVAHLGLYIEIRKLYGTKADYEKIINGHIYNLISALIRVDASRERSLMKKVIEDFPNEIARFTAEQWTKLDNAQLVINEQKQKLASSEPIIQNLKEQILKLSTEINMLKSSRVWKARNKVAKIVGKQVIK